MIVTARLTGARRAFGNTAFPLRTNGIDRELRRRGGPFDGATVNFDRAAIRPVRAEQRQRKLGSARAEQAGQAEDFAGMEVEANIFVLALPCHTDSGYPIYQRTRRIPLFLIIGAMICGRRAWRGWLVI